MTEKVTTVVRRGMLACATISILGLPTFLGCGGRAAKTERTEEEIQEAREEHGRLMLEEAK